MADDSGNVVHFRGIGKPPEPGSGGDSAPPNDEASSEQPSEQEAPAGGVSLPDELWFLRQDYQPCPEHNVKVGDYVFAYKPEYEEYFTNKALESGDSLVSISTFLGLPFKVVQFWAGRIKNFAVALDLAQQYAQAYWERKGQSCIMSAKFNAGGWLKMMAVRFPDTWREIDLDLTATAPDPYMLESPEDDQIAAANTQQLLAQLLRVKEADETPIPPAETEAG